MGTDAVKNKTREVFRMKVEGTYSFDRIEEEEKLYFTNGMHIYFEHEQDCCESVYVAWEEMDDLLKTTVFEGGLFIEIVDSCGIRINGHFVPCYDEQNGYYSNNLTLCIFTDQVQIQIDICGSTEPNYL